MKRAINNVKNIFDSYKLAFNKKPIIIGAMSLYYYGIKKERGQVELIVSEEDFEQINQVSEKNKEDIWGDFVITFHELSIWRSYSLFDYLFFKTNAIEEEMFYIISMDKLIFSKILKIESKKHYEELLLIRDYFYENYRNDEYVMYALSNYASYIKDSNDIF